MSRIADHTIFNIVEKLDVMSLLRFKSMNKNNKITQYLNSLQCPTGFNTLLIFNSVGSSTCR